MNRFLELNSPKATVVKAVAKPQDPVSKLPMFNVPNKPPTSGNGVSVNDCKEFMISLEKELANVLKCKPPMRGMKNMGIILQKTYCLLITIQQ